MTITDIDQQLEADGACLKELFAKPTFSLALALQLALSNSTMLGLHGGLPKINDCDTVMIAAVSVVSGKRNDSQQTVLKIFFRCSHRHSLRSTHSVSSAKQCANQNSTGEENVCEHFKCTSHRKRKSMPNTTSTYSRSHIAKATTSTAAK